MLPLKFTNKLQKLRR